jgi:hypothetical protein
MKIITFLLTLFLLAGCVSNPTTPRVEAPTLAPSETNPSTPTLAPAVTSTSIPDTLPTPIELPTSMKGYELYSWQVDGEWHFTLITGTNRNKTVEEIKAEENVESADGWVKISVTGTDALKALLARLPEFENVFWVDGLIAPAEFAKPPADVVDDVQAYSEGLGLDFYVSR